MRHHEFALGVVIAIAACTPQPSSHVIPSAGADTVVGVVKETGFDPSTFMSVQPAVGPTLRLSGAGATILRGTIGAEVWLQGARTSDGFRVDQFEVRRANGRPVDDGIVSVSQNVVTIRLRSGAQREVPNAPDALRALGGARIWISRPEPNTAPSYGVIQRL